MRYLQVSNPWRKAPCGDEGQTEPDFIRISCELIHSDRRTLSIQVKEDGLVVLRLPRRVDEEEAMSFAKRHSDWISAHYRKAVDIGMNRREHDASEILKYKKLLRPVLEHRVSYYAELMGVTYGRISIRDQKTRWGSCSAKGNLNFNWKLSLAPPEILDYVVVHELAHRIEMNHSPQFWALVERILPDYRQRRNWLKENGRGL